MQLKLNECEERFKVAFEYAIDAIVWFDPKTSEITNCNKAAEILLEQDKEELIGMHQSHIHPKQDARFYIAMFKRYIELKGFLDERMKLKTKSGRTIPVTVMASMARISDKQILQAIFHDISEYAWIENKLRESQERLDLALEGANLGSWDWNLKTGEIIFNKHLAEMLGYKLIELEPNIKIWEQFIHPDDIEVSQAAFITHIKGYAEFFETEQRLKTKNGGWKWLLCRGKIVEVDVENNPLRATGIYQDITEKKEAENMLRLSERKYKKEAEKSTFLKDVVSHDINNILHNIQSSLELQSMICKDEGYKNKKLDDLMQILQNQIIRGKKLISNVRNLSRLEEQQYSLKKLNLLPLLEEAISFIKQSFPARMINIDIIPTNPIKKVLANELLLDMFENILMNAVKYNDANAVEISIKISEKDKDDKQYLKIEFMDNGIGINDARKQLIFKRGQKEQKGVKGMGLGLSLVKKAIESYNGKIWVEDRIDGDYTKGSNFVILIPKT